LDIESSTVDINFLGGQLIYIQQRLVFQASNQTMAIIPLRTWQEEPSEIFPKDDDTTLVKGEVIWVNTDVKTNKSAPLPQELIALVKEKKAQASQNNKPHCSSTPS
jgi:hypothetical protein